jgi:hypothetical protein
VKNSGIRSDISNAFVFDAEREKPGLLIGVGMDKAISDPSHRKKWSEIGMSIVPGTTVGLDSMGGRCWCASLKYYAG